MAELPESVDRDILEGRNILAIARIREARGCSLREAIDLCAQRHGELHPAPDPPAEPPPSPRVLRFAPDGSLVVQEAPQGDPKPQQ